MKNLVYFIIFCLLTGCIACSQKTSKQVQGASESGGLPEINLKGEYPEKTISLQEIADVEYIPMETNPNVLIDFGGFFFKTVISDSLIVTFGNDGSVFVFNRQGRNLYTFNHQGRGPNEYLRLKDITVDFVEQEIYIVDEYFSREMLVYTFDGSFKRRLRLPAEYSIWKLFDYDRHSVLCYDGNGIEWEKEEIFNHQPYMLVSKKDGTITPLDLVLPDRFCPCLRPAERPGRGFHIGAYPIIRNGDEFLISDFAQDTIFCLKEAVLTPFLLKTPAGSWKSQVPELARVKLTTDKFTLIECIQFRFLEVPSSKLLGTWPVTECLYDHLTGEIYHPVFVNDDYKEGQAVWPKNSNTDLPSNYTCIALPAPRLLKDYKAGNLKGKLKEIASHLDEDANPVLMLIKFKE